MADGLNDKTLARASCAAGKPAPPAKRARASRPTGSGRARASPARRFHRPARCRSRGTSARFQPARTHRTPTHKRRIFESTSTLISTPRSGGRHRREGHEAARLLGKSNVTAQGQRPTAAKSNAITSGPTRAGRQTTTLRSIARGDRFRFATAREVRAVRRRPFEARVRRAGRAVANIAARHERVERFARRSSHER